MNYFAKNLVYLRKQRKMSPSELAKKLNVVPSTVSRWENKEMGISVDNAYDVAVFFNISIADLCGRDLSCSEDITVKNNDISLLEQYQILFNKDDKLTKDQKDFFINFLTEKHSEIDKKI